MSTQVVTMQVHLGFKFFLADRTFKRTLVRHLCIEPRLEVADSKVVDERVLDVLAADVALALGVLVVPVGELAVHVGGLGIGFLH